MAKLFFASESELIPDSSEEVNLRCERTDVLDADGIALGVIERDRNQEQYSQECDHQDKVSQHLFSVPLGGHRLGNAMDRFRSVNMVRVSWHCDDWNLH